MYTYTRSEYAASKSIHTQALHKRMHKYMYTVVDTRYTSDMLAPTGLLFEPSGTQEKKMVHPRVQTWSVSVKDVCNTRPRNKFRVMDGISIHIYIYR